MTHTKRTSPPKLVEDKNVTAITEPADSRLETVAEPKAKITKSRKSSTAAMVSPDSAISATEVSATEEGKTTRSSNRKSKDPTDPVSPQKAIHAVDSKKSLSEDGESEAVSSAGQDEIDRMIAEAAYYIAEKRNFEPGHEEDDWVSAREEVMSLLQGGNL
ncbi:MAG: DUF2934 domain-containing protein [Methylococcaceae bacterium]|nr:DUF2934 domain-containing protein [Methylococcaceae bacterium]